MVLESPYSGHLSLHVTDAFHTLNRKLNPEVTDAYHPLPQDCPPSLLELTT